ncbi:MAG TPA: cyanophycin synthetase, partial [Bacilli bacterium]|nr:cyanophycin synthetase [Bacilli bacterium]
DIQNIKVSLTETTYTYKDFNYSLQLLGHHQACNSVLSIEVAKYLQKYFPITHDNIVRGLKNTTWPGRIEVLRHEPLMIVDGAHNEGGIESLVSFIKDVNLDKKTRIIFAVSHDKEKDVMIKKLEEVAFEMIFTEYHYKRSNRAEELYNLSTHPNKHYILEVKELIEELIDNNDQMMNVFCGSLYFASEVRKILLSQKG